VAAKTSRIDGATAAAHGAAFAKIAIVASFTTQVERIIV
jgi:hypothetical protein